MAELPTSKQLLLYRSDLDDYLPEKRMFVDVMADALLETKRFLEDSRGVLWTQVFNSTTDDYYVDPDGIERNKDRLHKAIILFTISILFKDYSITSGDGAWWDLYLAFRADAESTVKTAKLDLDLDESGSIEDSETSQTGQTFLIR